MSKSKIKYTNNKYKKLKHLKKNSFCRKSYDAGVKRDIDAFNESQKSSKERLYPKDIPDQIEDLKLQVKKYTIPKLSERKKVRKDFEYKGRKEFLKHLAETQNARLKKAGLTVGQIRGMKAGNSPKGFHVHHILPIHGGGKNDFSNLALVQASPYHKDFHNKIINPQLRGMKDGETRMVKLPIPRDGVFVSRQRAQQLKDRAILMQKRRAAKAKAAGR